ncbi:MAG TPA: hypothetical protein VFR68_04275 [Candidatus Dormibacteraeota bacterium]|nr:hypothetical protein [Candidatus Dormibacteraeota bacterium]
MEGSEGPRPQSAVLEPPATADQPGRRGRVGRRWLIVGGIAVVFLLAIGYILGGAAAASGGISRADSALKGTVSHNNAIVDMFASDPFKKVNLNSDTPDIAGAKAAVTTYKGQLETWQADVTADRAALQKARADLQSSFLTLPEQSIIDDRRHRIDAGLSALNTAQHGIDLYNQQVAFIEPFLDAVAGFVALGNAQDIAGVQAELPGTGANLQKAVGLAKPPAIPSQVTPMLTAMQHAVSDLQAMAVAVQANDEAAFNRANAALDADLKTVTGFDTTPLDNAEKATFQPLADAYNSNMKIASGE